MTIGGMPAAPGKNGLPPVIAGPFIPGYIPGKGAPIPIPGIPPKPGNPPIIGGTPIGPIAGSTGGGIVPFTIVTGGA